MKEPRTYFKNNMKTRERIIILNIFLTANLILPTLSKNGVISNSSYITLKMNKTGDISIFRNFEENGAPFPDEIIINGKNQDKINSTYYFNQTNNNITIIWHNPITTAYGMFSYCSNITEVDLSHIYTSKIKTLNFLFE